MQRKTTTRPKRPSLSFVGHGFYIALEGGEGTGKSTQVSLLANALNALAVREPGGTPTGLVLRGVMADPKNTSITPLTEALLMAADRHQLMTEVLEPALASGQHVVSDRSVYSSLAYQGFGRGLDLERLRSINDWALGGRWPDVVVLIDVDSDTTAKRIGHRTLDRFEQSGDEFFKRVADGFHSLAAEDPSRWVVVDGAGTTDEVHHRILNTVNERMSHQGAK